MLRPAAERHLEAVRGPKLLLGSAGPGHCELAVPPVLNHHADTFNHSNIPGTDSQCKDNIPNFNVTSIIGFPRKLKF